VDIIGQGTRRCALRGRVSPVALLDESARREFLDSHPGWELSGQTITKTYRFAGFARSIGFVASVGVLAEKAFHHPDIDIRYNRVKVSLTTHDQGGLTRKDTRLAARIDRLAGG
jgi:4a-hydroxytetrahydrobiopterin dehydratase